MSTTERTTPRGFSLSFESSSESNGPSEWCCLPRQPPSSDTYSGASTRTNSNYLRLLQEFYVDMYRTCGIMRLRYKAELREIFEKEGRR